MDTLPLVLPNEQPVIVYRSYCSIGVNVAGSALPLTLRIRNVGSVEQMIAVLLNKCSCAIEEGIFPVDPELPPLEDPRCNVDGSPPAPGGRPNVPAPPLADINCVGLPPAPARVVG